MYEMIFLLILAFVWIIFASVQDLKKREVADWLNFSLIIFALGFRFFYCLFDTENFIFFYQGLIGLAIFFVIGNFLYYGRFFAGGDAKLMIALGTILPLSNSFFINLKIFSIFFIIFLFAGAFYGLFCTFVLAFSNLKNFKREFIILFNKYKIFISFFLFVSIFIILLGFLFNYILLAYFGILVFILPYLFLFAKAVEEGCLIKEVKSRDLTEGDWLYKDIKVGNKIIKSKWDGLNKEEITLIRKNKKSVLIKQGIPFIPVFLISLLVLIYFLWNSFWEFNIF